MNNELPELSSPISLNHAADGNKAGVAVFVAQGRSLPDLEAPVSLNHGSDESKAPAMVFVARG